jgi:hypothetical protein
LINTALRDATVSTAYSSDLLSSMTEINDTGRWLSVDVCCYQKRIVEKDRPPWRGRPLWWLHIPALNAFGLPLELAAHGNSFPSSWQCVPSIFPLMPSMCYIQKM